MKGIEMIRQLYCPIQPVINESKELVSYQETLPAPPLQNFIYCYWQLKTTKSLHTPFNHRVIADGCIDIFFDLNNPSSSFVMGFCKKYTEFPLQDSFNYIGIRFLPTIFPQLFKINAAEISNRFESLDLVTPQTATFIKQELNEKNNLEEIRDHLDQYFQQTISSKPFEKDPRLYEAIDIILKNQGVLNIETDLKTGISPRQLRRLFKFYIGDTAKTFSKLFNFKMF